jgi:1-deoxy-D-xylulose-5-phosphate synthase
MAYEALNNLGRSKSRVVVILNDNGRSYAPTISQLSQSLTTLRLNPTYLHTRSRVRNLLREIPAVGELAYSGLHGVTSGLREMVAPHIFFEALGVRYAGPIDGHDIAVMEQALVHAAEWDGPIVVHVLTQKGRGYAPAEEDEEQCLHDVKARRPPAATPAGGPAAPSIPARAATRSGAPAPAGAEAAPALVPSTYTEAFTRALIRQAEERPELVALTAAMPGPTGLLPFQQRFPGRCFDVGIAEQHEMTSAAGMAMGGLRPVVAVYSTFFSRAFDQANLDVSLHGLPVLVALDRAGITGDNGPSHHGVLDLALTLSIPGMTVFAPSSTEELEAMVATALELEGPASIRYPSTPPRHVRHDEVGTGLQARRLRQGDGGVCLLGVGKLVAGCLAAADELESLDGVRATVWDVRVVCPPDLAMLEDAARHSLVVTAEDGVRFGGAGMFLADAMGRLPEADAPEVEVLGLPRRFIPQGRADDLLSELGLDGPGIARSTREALSLCWRRARARSR